MKYCSPRCLCLILAMLLLSGCTTGKHTGEAEPAGGKILRVANSMEPPTFDPARTQDVATNQILCNIFEALVSFDETNNLKPTLADHWELSADRRTYTFHLRKGVRFHNGRPLVADDVKYSLERSLRPDTHSPVALTYLGVIVGAKDLADGKTETLSGVTVLKPDTFTITIDQPRSYFLGMLSYPTAYIVCKEAIAANGGRLDGKAIVGTGPFKFSGYQPGQKVSLAANTDYWDGRPKIDGVDFNIFLDIETAYNNYVTGKLDLCGVSLNRYVQDKQANRLASDYQQSPLAETVYLTMNARHQPVFKSRDVRRAIAMAINRDEILKVAYHDVWKIANGFVPPELPNAGPPPPPFAYNPAEAKKLLAKAGYPDGKGFPDLSLVVMQGNSEMSATATIIRASLRANLGINVSLQEREPGQFFQDEAKGNIDFSISDWVADYPDAQDFLSLLLKSDASLNRAGYSSPEFDTLCTRADSEKDEHVRAELYGKANSLVMEDIPLFPICFGRTNALRRPNVHGIQRNVMTFLPFHKVTID